MKKQILFGLALAACMATEAVVYRSAGTLSMPLKAPIGECPVAEQAAFNDMRAEITAICTEFETHMSEVLHKNEELIEAIKAPAAPVTVEVAITEAPAPTE